MALLPELLRQPENLRAMLDAYESSSLLSEISTHFRDRKLIFTGMGASLHAAMIASYSMARYSIPHTVVDATDLMNYQVGMPSKKDVLIYISQSGTSGEIPALVDRLHQKVPLVAITNDESSTLASHAQYVLPMVSGKEELVASSTYINTLALLWLLVRQLGRKSAETDFLELRGIADMISGLLSRSGEIQNRMLQFYNQVEKPMVALGHGPQGVTARHSAMILSEWSKISVSHYSIGAFRHGYIEMIEPGMGVVVFFAPDVGEKSSGILVEQLTGLGAKVMRVEHGELLTTGEQVAVQSFDPELNPLVDIVPMQLFADALAQQRGFGNGFRYISKVVTQI